MKSIYSCYHGVREHVCDKCWNADGTPRSYEEIFLPWWKRLLRKLGLV